MASREFERIRWLRRVTGGRLPEGSGGRVLLGLGDDAALWKPPRGHAAVLTVDVQVEGVHFLPGWLSPSEIGSRAVASSASDLAAMGALPGGLLLAIALPRSASEGFFRAIYRGALEEARRCSLAVLGGNLSGGALQVTVTCIGAVLPGEAVARRGGRPGDGIYVTGWPGRARIGREILALGAARRDFPARGRAASACLRAFRSPRARIRESRSIVAGIRPRSMVDLSDGLAPDLLHILEASAAKGSRRQPGACLDPDRIAALIGEDGCGALAGMLGLDPVKASLEGGEDYELLFTAPPGRAERIAPEFFRRFGIPLTRIGTVEKEPGLRTSGAAAIPGRKIRPSGFDHFA